jgi:hypothetical protein
VPSLDDVAGSRRGLVVGLKSPGLDDGVLSAVFDIVDESVVEMQQQGECRHYVRGQLLSRSCLKVSKEETLHAFVCVGVCVGRRQWSSTR